MKFSTTLVKTNYGHYIPIPEENATQIIETFGKRVLCAVNGAEIHCAIQRNDRIGYFISAGKSTKKKIGAEGGDTLEIEIREDTSKYKMEMPEEMEAVLNTDPEGQKAFEKLTDGKKRSVLHHINSAKGVDTRINRALKVIENLKMGKTDLRDLMK